MWAKLSPNTDRLVEVAQAVAEAGADALTLVNTVLGLAVDVETARPVLGNGGGGVSGRAIHAVALRAVYDVRAVMPDIPIVGVGGISRGEHAIAMLQVGANAVQVGTASFARPDAAMVVLNEMHAWASSHKVTSWKQVTGAVFR
jgi:dihydroorotate dehydrogenase (NAD+) catalytic subunit